MKSTSIVSDMWEDVPAEKFQEILSQFRNVHQGLQFDIPPVPV